MFEERIIELLSWFTNGRPHRWQYDSTIDYHKKKDDSFVSLTLKKEILKTRFSDKLMNRVIFFH